MSVKKRQATVCSRQWFFVPFDVTSALPVLAQLFQQRLGLLQILGVKPFGEPLIDRSEQCAGFRGLALSLPDASEARHCS